MAKKNKHTLIFLISRAPIGRGIWTNIAATLLPNTLASYALHVPRTFRARTASIHAFQRLLRYVQKIVESF